jgi:chromosome segregation ATPase
MKKFAKLFAITLSVMAVTAGIAAAETKFTPLNFGDSTPVKTTAVQKATVDANGEVLLDPSQVTGGTKMQSAILQLDNAQVEVRNQLLNYRTSFSELDNKYKTVKTERKAAKKKIKQAEKRIKNLEKAKKKIRKNFEQKINM